MNDHPAVSLPGEPEFFRNRSLLLLYGFALFSLLLLLNSGILRTTEGEWATTLYELHKGRWFYDAAQEWRPTDSGTLFATQQLTTFTSLNRNGGVSLWSIRILPVIFAMLTLAGCVKLGQKLISPRCGICAGWLLVGSCGFLYWGKTASGAMAGACAAVYWAGMIYGRRGLPKTWGTYFNAFLLLFLTLFYCGIFTVLLLLVIAIPEFCNRNFWKSNINMRLADGFFIALIVSLGILFFTFGIFSTKSFHQAFSHMVDICIYYPEHLLTAFLKCYSGEPWYYSLLNIPKMLLPWTPFAIISIAGMLYRKQLQGDVARLLCGIGAALVVFGIYPGIRWNLLLPLLPLLMIFTAMGFEREFQIRFWNLIAERVMYFIVIISAAAAISFPMTMPLWREILQQSPPILMMILLLVCGVTTLALIVLLPVWRREACRWLGIPLKPGITIVAGTIMMSALLGIVQPLSSLYRTGYIFWKECSEYLYAHNVEMVIFYGEPPSPEARYYMNFNRNTIIVESPEKLIRVLNENKNIRKTIICQNSDMLPQSPDMPLLHRSLVEKDAVNIYINAPVRKRRELWDVR